MAASLRGVNLVGAEWAYIPNFTPVDGTHYEWISHADIDYLAIKQVPFVRLVFSWEILQPTLNGTFAAAYDAKMFDRVSYATAKGMKVMIEPHGGGFTHFARYKGDVVGSAAVPYSAFANLWSQLANRYKANPLVIFGLSNEPNNMPTTHWFDAAQAAITAIRAANFTNMIMVPGNGFSQPGTWNDTWYDTGPAPKKSNAQGWAGLMDPLDNIVVTVHTYFDFDASGGHDDILNVNVIGQRLQPVVTWARARGLKVHLSEFGANNQTAMSDVAVANAIAYMDANCDVVIGWAWWAYGPPASGWATYRFTLCPTPDYATDNPKMAWLQPLFNAPCVLHMRDNLADAGSEPNLTTTIGWESTDIAVTQAGGGTGTVAQPIVGGQPAEVRVTVRNQGMTPSDGSDVVRLYWAKANAGLSWPYPGSPVASPWVPITPTQPVPPLVACGESTVLVFPWTPPDPAAFGGDDHFCLLAHAVPSSAAQWEGFAGADLNQNVLKLRNVAWRNIHIIAMAKMKKKKLGNLLISNYLDTEMHAQVAFQFLDAAGKAGAAHGTLFVTPDRPALDKLRRNPRPEGPFLEEDRDGVFRLINPTSDMPRLQLAPGEVVRFTLEYEPERPEQAFAIRAIQYAVEGAFRKKIGGQTFVAGGVNGLSRQPPRRRTHRWWPWLAGSLSFFLLTSALGTRATKKRRRR